MIKLVLFSNDDGISNSILFIIVKPNYFLFEFNTSPAAFSPSHEPPNAPAMPPTTEPANPPIAAPTGPPIIPPNSNTAFADEDSSSPSSSPTTSNTRRCCYCCISYFPSIFYISCSNSCCISCNTNRLCNFTNSIQDLTAIPQCF